MLTLTATTMDFLAMTAKGDLLDQWSSIDEFFYGDPMARSGYEQWRRG